MISLGERYGLRIIPGQNFFLVLPNNISRSTAVGAILHPGGPSHFPLSRAAWASPESIEHQHSHDVDFVLAIGKDEKLMRRLNELDNAETISTSGSWGTSGFSDGAGGTGSLSGTKGTDAKWKLKTEDVMNVLWRFAETK